MRKEDFLRDLKSTNPIELGLDDWFNFYLKQGFYRSSAEQKSDIRALESKEMAHKSLWECRGDHRNYVMESRTRRKR